MFMLKVTNNTRSSQNVDIWRDIVKRMHPRPSLFPFFPIVLWSVIEIRVNSILLSICVSILTSAAPQYFMSSCKNAGGIARHAWHVVTQVPLTLQSNCNLNTQNEISPEAEGEVEWFQWCVLFCSSETIDELSVQWIASSTSSSSSERLEISSM